MTHKERVLQYLIEKGSITSWEAIKEFGNTRLSATIFNLRQEDYNIKTKFETNINRYGDKISYARYVLESEEE